MENLLAGENTEKGETVSSLDLLDIKPRFAIQRRMKIDAFTLKNVQRPLPQLECLRGIKGTDERRLLQPLIGRTETLADLRTRKRVERKEKEREGEKEKKDTVFGSDNSPLIRR